MENIPNQNHSNVKPYKCDICDKHFSTQKAVDEHKTELHSTRYRCDFCDETFSRKATPDIHINTLHLENKSFKCDL